MPSIGRSYCLELLFFLTGVLTMCCACQKQANSVTRETADENPSVGVAPEVEIERLIQGLKNQDDNQGSSTSLKLAQFRSAAVPQLTRGLESSDVQTRKSCARSLTHLAGAPEVATAGGPLLTALAKETVPGVSRSMVQAVKSIHPNADRAIPILITILNVDDFRLQIDTVDAIATYWLSAVTAKPSLHELLKKTNNDWLRISILSCLESIGFDSQDAESISKLHFSETPRAAGDAVRILLSYPDSVLDFLKLNPFALSEFDRGVLLDSLVSILKDDSPGNSKLRDHLRNRDDLPSIAMVHIGAESYLPAIQSRIAKADPHQRTYLEACARSLGAGSTTMIRISAGNPGNFRPTSAHPGTNKDRWAAGDGHGHGDGSTQVLITGKLVMSDGSPVKAPNFFHASDRMLLGQNRKDPAKLLRFDETTGRFVFNTSVFAAYSIAKGQKEPGPYQTGAAKMVIEAEGALPLEVSFYDEMPDVEITLTAK